MGGGFGVGFRCSTICIQNRHLKDAGKKFALLGGIVAILGLLASLFTRRRRIWIRVGSQVEVAGLAKNGAPGLDVEMEQFIRMLKGDK